MVPDGHGRARATNHRATASAVASSTRSGSVSAIEWTRNQPAGPHTSGSVKLTPSSIIALIAASAASASDERMRRSPDACATTAPEQYTSASAPPSALSALARAQPGRERGAHRSSSLAPITQ